MPMVKIVFKVLLYLMAIVGLSTTVSTIYFNYFFDPQHFEVLDSNEFEPDSHLFSSMHTKYVYLNYGVTNLGDDFPEAEKGDAFLVAHFHSDGKPVEGLQITLVLNDGYKVPNLVTDKNGELRALLAPGEWVVNGFLLSSWEKKPKGGFQIVTGSEPTKDSEGFSGYPLAERAVIILTSGDQKSFGVFELTEEITILNPQKRDLQVVKDISNYDLKWSPHKNSVTYRVNVQSVNRKGRTTSYSSIFKKDTGNTFMALDVMPIYADDGEIDHEYAVEITGYDANGNFVSQTQETFDHRFKLNGMKIADSMVLDVGTIPEDELASYSQVAERIDAVKVLIDENMLDVAEQLLTKIDASKADWRLGRIQGYLEASRGNCEVAESYFESARSSARFDCIPSSYKAACD